MPASLHGGHVLRHLLRVGDEHLEHVDGVALVEEALRLGERHEDHGAVVLRHAHLEDGRHLVGLDARRRAEGRRLRPRGDTSVTVSPTLTRSELARRVPMAMPSWRSKPSSVPKRTLLAIERQRLEAVLAHAAHEAGERQVRRGGHRLALDQRHHLLDARRPSPAARAASS